MEEDRRIEVGSSLPSDEAMETEYRWWIEEGLTDDEFWSYIRSWKDADSLIEECIDFFINLYDSEGKFENLEAIRGFGSRRYDG